LGLVAQEVLTLLPFHQRKMEAALVFYLIAQLAAVVTLAMEVLAAEETIVLGLAVLALRVKAMLAVVE
jgi:hypothetical protein